MDRRSEARRVALVGVLTALALILGYVEAILPFHFGLPGVKLGLANLAVVTALYLLGTGEALLVDLVRIVLSATLFGTAVSLWYSLAGGLLSFAVMALARRRGYFGIPGVSVLGGVCHNIGQMAVAALVLGSGKALWYLPALLAAGAVTGAVIGAAASRVVPRIAPLAPKRRPRSRR